MSKDDWINLIAGILLVLACLILAAVVIYGRFAGA